MGAPAEVAVREMALTPAGVDPMLAMMERLASNKDVDVVKLQALIDMQKDIMAVNAKAAFNTAFAKLQQALPTVIEKGRTNNGAYARLEDIIETVRPVLGAEGFSLSHRTEWPDKGTVKVIGILTHEQGYSRESEFLATADTSGNKNAIQALGSAVSYGRRYTTKDLLNIVTKEEDDDGKKAGNVGKPDPPAKFDQWWLDMGATADTGIDALEKAWKDSSKEFKAYVDRHMKRDWQTLKKKAEAHRG